MESMEFWDWVYRTTYQREMNLNKGYQSALSSAKKAAEGALRERAAVKVKNPFLFDPGVCGEKVPVRDGSGAAESNE
jgi:hypothetical protein